MRKLSKRQRKIKSTGFGLRTDFSKVLQAIEERKQERQQDFETKKLLAETLVPKGEVGELSLELLRMSISIDDFSEKRLCYLGDKKEEARRIGERLNQIGGFELMVKAALLVPLFDRRELDMAWDGIGDWKC